MHGWDRGSYALTRKLEILFAEQKLLLQNFTMLIRAMRRLNVTPPRSWLEAAGTDLVDRVVHLLQVSLVPLLLMMHRNLRPQMLIYIPALPSRAARSLCWFLSSSIRDRY